MIFPINADYYVKLLHVKKKFCSLLALDFTLEIRVSEEWDDRLSDTSSKKFKELANRMQQQVY